MQRKYLVAILMLMLGFSQARPAAAQRLIERIQDGIRRAREVAAEAERERLLRDGELDNEDRRINDRRDNDRRSERREPERRERTPPVEERPAPEVSRPGYLGVVGDDTDDEQGVLVLTVREGSPASEAGLLVGDVIVSLNDQRIRNLDDMADALQQANAGERIAVQYLRDGERRAKQIVLAERGGEVSTDEPSLPEPVTDDPPPQGGATLGVGVSDLTERLRTRYRIPVREGAFIQVIQEDSPADEFGLPLSGVIVSIDGAPVTGAKDLLAALRDAQPGQEVELTYYDRDELQKKRVRLAPDDPQPSTAEATAAARTGDRERRAAGSVAASRTEALRPLIDRLGQVIDEVVTPALAEIPTEPAATTDGAVPQERDPLREEERDALREEVQRLRQQVEKLQQQLDEFQNRLPANENREAGSRRPL